MKTVQEYLRNFHCTVHSISGLPDFKTKLDIMGNLFAIASENFNVTGKVVDSWYSSFTFLYCP